jgi:signal transduction histidine kinase
MDHFVKALSHDMNANLMLLEHSVRDLKKSIGQSPLQNIADGFTHVEASLRESRRFVDDLVKLSQSGQMDMQPQSLDLGTLVHEVLFEQKSLLRERGIAVEVEKNLPTIWCNENRIKQLFTNLIRNAARHGCDNSQPQIKIGVARLLPSMIAGELHNRVAMAIHDNGPGIPERWREEIFLPGRRIPGTASTGTGMGLAIAKRIIDHYEGTILVDPNCPQGTRFIFTLPLAADS